MVEGLILMISKARNEEKITSVKIFDNHVISHSLFVDGVLIFGDSSTQEWIEYQGILNIVYSTSGMVIRYKNSLMMYNGLNH